MARVETNPTFRLQIVGPAEDVPLGLVGEGKDCDGRGRYYYRAAPTKSKAALVHQIGSEAYLWTTSAKARADGPREPKGGKPVTEAVAVRALASVKTSTPKATGKGDLKGNWKGHVECTSSGPEVVLVRDISGYGRIAVVGKMHRTHSDVKVAVKVKNSKGKLVPKKNAKGKTIYRPKKNPKTGKTERRTTTSVKWGVAAALGRRWESKGKPNAKNVGGYTNLRAAIDAGYKALADLISGKCAPKIMKKSKQAKANEKKTTGRKKQADGTYKTVKKTPTATKRKVASNKARATRLVQRGVKVPVSKKKLIGKKILLKHGSFAGRFGKIVGVEPDKNGKWGGKGVNPVLVVALVVRGDKGKGRLAKTFKKIPQYVTRAGKRSAVFTAGKTVDKNFRIALAKGIISYTPAGKKKVTAAKRAAAPKKTTAKRKTTAKGPRLRSTPTAAQSKLKGSYVTWGGKDGTSKRNGKVLELRAGGTAAKPNWNPAAGSKLVIDVAERGSAGTQLVVTEVKFSEHGGRKIRGNSSKAWRAARAKKDGKPPTKRRSPKKTEDVGSALVGVAGSPSAASELAQSQAAAARKLAEMGF